MYLISGEDFIDGELSKLAEFLSLIDSKLIDIEFAIEKSVDPDSGGLFDRAEYFIGLGFVAIQQYLLDTLILTGIDKKVAYCLGPMHKSGISYVNAMNSAANWWKHEAEWFNAGEIPNSGKSTHSNVQLLANSHEYALSNLLAALNATGKLSLSALLPALAVWRSAIQSARV